MKKAHYYLAYNRLLKSDFDLTPVGLRPVKQEPPLNEQLLIISNAGRLGSDHRYLNNQTMVNSPYGYYYKQNIGLFEFISGDEIRVFIDYLEFDADFVRTLLNYPISCAFYQKTSSLNQVCFAQFVRFTTHQNLPHCTR